MKHLVAALEHRSSTWTGGWDCQFRSAKSHGRHNSSNRGAHVAECHATVDEGRRQQRRHVLLHRLTQVGVTLVDLLLNDGRRHGAPLRKRPRRRSNRTAGVRHRRRRSRRDHPHGGGGACGRLDGHDGHGGGCPRRHRRGGGGEGALARGGGGSHKSRRGRHGKGFRGRQVRPRGGEGDGAGGLEGGSGGGGSEEMR